MKQTKLFLIAAILILGLLSSCKDSTNLTNAIPAGAITVIHFDTKSLLSKADYKPLENKHIKGFFEKEKNSGSEKNNAMMQKFEDFLKNPNSTGIDLLGDCYMYVDSASMGFIWGMNDANKFKELLTKSFELPAEIIKEENGISTIDMSGIAKLGWTKDKMLIVMATTGAYMYGLGEQPDLIALLKKQLTQTSDQSINSNKAFAEFSKNKKDISFFYSYDNVAKMWNNTFSQLSSMLPTSDAPDAPSVAVGIKDMMKGVSAAGFVSFEKGEVVMENNIYYATPEAEKKFTDLMTKVSGEIKGDQMKFLAEKPIFLAAMNIKGEGLYNYLSEMGVMNLINTFAGTQMEEMGVDLKALISNVDGDMSISINSVRSVMKKSPFGDYEYPSTEIDLSVFADLKDPMTTWNFIKEKISETKSDSTLVEINPTTYSFSIDDNMKAYIGISNNTMYFTNSEVIYKNISTATETKNDFASLGTGKTSFFFGNLNPLKSPAMSSMSNEDAKLQEFISKGFDLLGDFSYTTEKNMGGKGKFVINDNSSNSLNVICKYIDSIVTYAIESKM